VIGNLVAAVLGAVVGGFVVVVVFAVYLSKAFRR
jgi:hypothetical protein